jgi:WD40 repeat protein
MAGRLGFVGLLDDHFANNYFAFGHSGYFVKGKVAYDHFMKTRWVPLLCDGVPPPIVDERVTGGPIAGAATWLLQNSEPIKLGIYVAPLIAITIFSLFLFIGAVARQLAAETTSDKGDTPGLAMLLAVESSRLRHSENSEAALINVLQVDPAVAKFLYGPSNGLGGIAYNHLGNAVALSDHSGCVYTYDATTGEQTDHFCLPADAFAESLSFTMDDRRLLIGSGDGSLSIWNLAKRNFDASRVAAHKFQGDEPTTFLPLPGGKEAVSIAGDSVLKVWNIEGQLKPLRGVHVDVDPFSAVIHPDGRHVYLGGSAGEISLWDLDPSPHRIRTIHPHREIVFLGLNSDGTTLASTDRTKPELRFWNPKTLNETRKLLTLPGQGGTGVGFPAKSSQIVVSNAFETISVFDDPTGENSVQLRGVNVPFSLSPDGNHIAVGLQDDVGTAILDLRSAHSIARQLPKYDQAAILQVGVSGDGQTATVVHSDGYLYVEELESGKLDFQTHLTGGPFSPSVGFNRDPRHVKVMPLPSFGPVLTFSRKNRLLAISSSNNVCIYDVYVLQSRSVQL